MKNVITTKVIKRELVLSFYDKEDGYFEKEFHTMSKNWRVEIRDYKKTINAKYLGIKSINETVYAVSMNIDRFIENADEVIELGKEDLENKNESEEN